MTKCRYLNELSWAEIYTFDETTPKAIILAIQGILVPTGTETRQLFSCMFVKLKKIKELFYST